MLLLYFCNPVVTSLRGLQQTTTLTKVQERLGVRQTSLSARGEAAYVFDAALLPEILRRLGAPLRPHLPLAEQVALAQWTAVDGRLLPALPRMAWARWQDDPHRAAKRPGAFAVLRQGPVDVTVTARHGVERAEWRRVVPPRGFYVVDRGYADYSLLQTLHDLPCSFRCRVQDKAADEVPEERARAPAAAPAGAGHADGLRRLGTAHPTRLLPPPFHVGRVATGKTRKDGTPDVLVLVTHRLALDAELMAVAYRYRWGVEVFFRWVKGVPGCRPLLSQGINGGHIQVDAAFMARLLISLWVGQAPTTRTYERLCCYFRGWATVAKLIAHIDRLHLQAPPPCKNGAGHY